MSRKVLHLFLRGAEARVLLVDGKVSLRGTSTCLARLMGLTEIALRRYAEAKGWVIETHRRKEDEHDYEDDLAGDAADLRFP